MTTRRRNDGLRKICGCSRRVWGKCEHPWHFNFKWNGEVYRFTLERQVGRLVKRAKGSRLVWVRELSSLGDRIDSKAVARQEADRLRTAIRKGDFLADGPVRETLTVRHLLDTYKTREIEPRRPVSAVTHVTYQIGAITRVELARPDGVALPFGSWLVADVTTDAIEQLREARRARTVRKVHKDGKEIAHLSGGSTTANRDLALLRACFNWAIRRGIVERTPFKRSTETVVKLDGEIARSRRLQTGEEERLLAACKGPHLRALVEAALETGCRKGELLSLQWKQIRMDADGTPRDVFLPAQKTKTKRSRLIPVSGRLRAILEMRRNDPSGDPMPDDHYVFGNEIGQRVTSIKTAWRLACKRANIADLHFHDLRREAGSRWLDGGVPVQTVRDWLGHSNISQTSTYLQSTFLGQHEAMRRFEEKRRDVPVWGTPGAPRNAAAAALDEAKAH